MKLHINHLGIIMDGNRRWARRRGLPSLLGHQEGYENLVRIVDAAFSRGISTLTVFAFSTENWNRSNEEVNQLLALFSRAFSEQAKRLHEKNIRMRFIGSLHSFPSSLYTAMHEAMQLTIHNTAGQLNVAVNYGGRADLVNAIKALIAARINPDSVTEEMISSYLSTHGLPDPDLIIRTSGEQRLSGFLTWETVYSELYFTEKYWPEFSSDDLDHALAVYESRQRRFGS